MSADEKDEVVFSPTEELVGEVLVARYRLGEKSWTFKNNALTAIRKLYDKGYVEYKKGTPASPDHTLVWLTDKGRKEFLSYKYVARITEGSKKATKASKKIYKDARKLRVS